MSYRDVGGDHIRHEGAAPYVTPQACPACTSASIASTAKIPDANSYWRCLLCGEIWNPARRATHVPRRWPR